MRYLALGIALLTGCASPPQLRELHAVAARAKAAEDARQLTLFEAALADLRAEKRARAVGALVAAIRAAGDEVPAASILTGLVGGEEGGGLLEALETIDRNLAGQRAKWDDDPNGRIYDEAHAAVEEWHDRPNITAEQQDQLIREAAAWSARLREED